MRPRRNASAQSNQPLTAAPMSSSAHGIIVGSSFECASPLPAPGHAPSSRPDPVVEQAERARVGGGRRYQGPGRARRAVVKQAWTTSGQLRAQGDAEPVQLAGFQQVADDAAAGQDDDVAAGLVAELPDGGGRIGGCDAGVVPVRVLEGAGEYDLLDRVQPPGEGPVFTVGLLVLGDGGPERGEALVVLAAQQRRGGR